MKILFALFALLILNCNRSNSQKSTGTLEINTNLNDRFFSDKVYSKNPVSINLFKNDTF
jgi:hypothetical protein